MPESQADPKRVGGDTVLVASTAIEAEAVVGPGVSPAVQPRRATSGGTIALDLLN
jgi:hypothetical protein